MAKQPGKTAQTLMQYCEVFGCKNLLYGGGDAGGCFFACVLLLTWGQNIGVCLC